MDESSINANGNQTTIPPVQAKATKQAEKTRSFKAALLNAHTNAMESEKTIATEFEDSDDENLKIVMMKRRICCPKARFQGSKLNSQRSTSRELDRITKVV